MSTKIAFFDTKPYDRDMFDEINRDYGYDIQYHKFNITADNALLAEGFDMYRKKAGVIGTGKENALS